VHRSVQGAPHPVVRTPPTPHTLNVEKHMASGTLDTPAGTAPTTLAGPNGNGRAAIPARTLRTDNWRKAPILTVVLLTAWILYAVVRAFMQKWYWVEDYHYLTPFYSPCVSNGCEGDSSLFGRFIPDIPIFPFAVLTLPFLGLFRLTCYYYRRAYYRSYWGSPPACAVPDLHKSYQGESRMPGILQNSHRYFFYAAVLLSIVNTIDAILAFHSPGGFGIGLGTIILVINVILLWAYTVSCHSCRHIIGGRLRHFSKHPVRYRAWGFVSKLNTKHMELAWTTLGTLVVTDFYIMAVAAGWISDLRIVG
jgi:hypothetical protein